MAETVTIKDVQTILTQPAGSKLVIVKIITSDDGLYGLGCATFTQRFMAVKTAIDEHLKPFLIGRDVDGEADLGHHHGTFVGVATGEEQESGGQKPEDAVGQGKHGMAAKIAPSPL